MDYFLRYAYGADVHYLIDIDLKCNDDAWTSEEWRALDSGNVLIATYLNTPVAMCVYRHDEEGTVAILKLAVKRAHRTRGIARVLVNRVIQYAATTHTGWVTIVVPEHRLCPGQPEDISSFLKRLGFRAEIPLLTDYFIAYGEPESGVRFSYLVPQE